MEMWSAVSTFASASARRMGRQNSLRFFNHAVVVYNFMLTLLLAAMFVLLGALRLAVISFPTLRATQSAGERVATVLMWLSLWINVSTLFQSFLGVVGTYMRSDGGPGALTPWRQTLRKNPGLFTKSVYLALAAVTAAHLWVESVYGDAKSWPAWKSSWFSLTHVAARPVLLVLWCVYAQLLHSWHSDDNTRELHDSLDRSSLRGRLVTSSFLVISTVTATRILLDSLSFAAGFVIESPEPSELLPAPEAVDGEVPWWVPHVTAALTDIHAVRGVFQWTRICFAVLVWCGAFLWCAQLPSRDGWELRGENAAADVMEFTWPAVLLLSVMQAWTDELVGGYLAFELAHVHCFLIVLTLVALAILARIVSLVQGSRATAGDGWDASWENDVLNTSVHVLISGILATVAVRTVSGGPVAFVSLFLAAYYVFSGAVKLLAWSERRKRRRICNFFSTLKAVSALVFGVLFFLMVADHYRTTRGVNFAGMGYNVHVTKEACGARAAVSFNHINALNLSLWLDPDYADSLAEHYGVDELGTDPTEQQVVEEPPVCHDCYSKSGLEARCAAGSLPQYSVCGHRWHGLSVIDYGLLSMMAYFDPATQTDDIIRLLEILFPKTSFDGQRESDDGGSENTDSLGKGTVASSEPVRATGESMFEMRTLPSSVTDVVPSFEVYSARLNVSVVVVRGTDVLRPRDMVEDAALFAESALMSVLRLFPTVRLWSHKFESMVIGQFFQEALAPFGLQYDSSSSYYAPLVRYVEGVHDRHVVMTGHSLGGGLAHIVGSFTERPSVAFSPPGVLELRRKLHYEGERLHQHHILHRAVAIMPQLDPVPLIGAQAGLVQKIRCTHPFGVLGCHMVERSICELLDSCGDHRGRFTGCQTRYTTNDQWARMAATYMSAVATHQWAKNKDSIIVLGITAVVMFGSQIGIWVTSCQRELRRGRCCGRRSQTAEQAVLLAGELTPPRMCFAVSLQVLIVGALLLFRYTPIFRYMATPIDE